MVKITVLPVAGPTTRAVESLFWIRRKTIKSEMARRTAGDCPTGRSGKKSALTEEKEKRPGVADLNMLEISRYRQKKIKKNPLGRHRACSFARQGGMPGCNAEEKNPFGFGRCAEIFRQGVGR